MNRTEFCKNRYRQIALLIIAYLSVQITACDSFNQVCPGIFYTYNVSVTDANGNPVVFDRVTITNLRNDREIDLCAESQADCFDGIKGFPENGIYTIFDDSKRDLIGFPPLPVLFTGSNDSVSVDRMFLFEDNGCNAKLLTGKTEIVLE